MIKAFTTEETAKKPAPHQKTFKFPVETKLCSRCKENRPLVWFHKDKQRPDGYRVYCKICIAHDDAVLQANDLPPDKIKRCSQCKQFKSLAMFHRRIQAPDGHTPCCKNCTTKISLRRSNNQKKKCLEYERKSRIQTRYSISQSAYDEMVSSQSNRCAICRDTEINKLHGKTIRLAIDHDHNTKMVRGLLCHKCNMLLGYARDDEDILLQAVSYLSKARNSTIRLERA